MEPKRGTRGGRGEKGGDKWKQRTKGGDKEGDRGRQVEAEEKRGRQRGRQGEAEEKKGETSGGRGEMGETKKRQTVKIERLWQKLPGSNGGRTQESSGIQIETFASG